MFFDVVNQESGNAQRCRLMAALLLGSALTPAAAQVVGPSSSAEQATGGVLEEILVTARKRVESVQDVPATIGVISPQALAITGVSNLQQLQTVAPGINLGKAPSGNEIGVTIRGLGSSPGVPSFDSSVSLFIDGVYAPRSREFAASMFDVQRIEVIRGTQAALLGKNTSLGAINLISRKPGDHFEADGRASYEFERGSKLATGGVDLPVSDTLKARVSGQFSDDNGFVHNVLQDNYSPRIRDRAIRGVLVWEPGEGIDITGVVQHDVAKNYGVPTEIVASTGVPELLGALAGYPGLVDASLARRNAANGREQSERLAIDKYNVTANVDINGNTLTSITAYSRYHDQNSSDADSLPGDYLFRDVNEIGKQFSQEVRIVSDAAKPFDYIVGALYLQGKLDDTESIGANYPFGPAPGVNLAGTQRTAFVQDNDAVSLFAQPNYKLDNGLRFSGGVRWTREKKDVDLGRDVVVHGFFSDVVSPPFPSFSMSRTETNFDYSAGVQYEISPNTLTYVSYGKGTKGGGYAQSVTLLPDAEYAKEVARTTEVGIKLQDAGREWVFNLAAFNTVVDDFQLVTFNGINFVIGNTDLRSRGFELETSWFPVKGLRLFLNNTYADVKDIRTGGPVPLAPKWTGSGGFGYQTASASGLDIKTDGSIDYRSKRYYQMDTTSPVGEAFTTYNLSVAIGPSDNHWEARLIGRNLTDVKAIAFGASAPFMPAGNQYGIAERGRTVALQLSFQY